MLKLTKNRLLVLVVTVVFAFTTWGCGSLIYPERIGATNSNKIDPTVALMDAFWLLIGIVPGVVAFAVDFYNGAIFYPTGAVLRPGEEATFYVRGRGDAHERFILRMEDASGNTLTDPVVAELPPEHDNVAELRIALPRELRPGMRIMIEASRRRTITWTIESAPDGAGFVLSQAQMVGFDLEERTIDTTKLAQAGTVDKT